MKAAVGVGLLVAALGLGAIPAEADTLCELGDVLVGGAEGTTLIFGADGHFKRRLHRSPGSEKTGMCFDREGSLYASSFTDGSVLKFNHQGELVAGRWVGGFDRAPETCVVDAEGNLFVGEADGLRRVMKLDSGGRVVAAFQPRTESRGIDWLDLAADQCTLYYTSEGSQVMRYDVCRNRQLDGFAAGLPAPCFALRLRENGELLVACHERVLRFRADGSTVRTYSFPGETLFGMNLDPRGEVFWTGGITSGRVYRVNIESGRGAGSPLINATRFLVRDRPKGLLEQLLGGLMQLGREQIGGLAVCGERTQAMAQAEPPRAVQTAPEPPPPRQATLPPELPAQTEPTSPEPTPQPPPAPPLGAVVDFGSPPPIELGRLEAGTQAERRLDLTGARVEGEPRLSISTDLDLGGLALEIQTPQGWRTLGSERLELLARAGEARSWALRVRVGRCAQSPPAGSSYHVKLEAPGPAGQPQATLLPLLLQVAPSSGWRCWGPLVLGLVGLVLAGIVVHGLVSPSRFARRLGVVLSPEEDLGEGFFHPIRAQRGTGSGFYRDARVFLRPDYRLSGSALGAFARLRAHGGQVRLSPVGGASLFRQGPEGFWEGLPTGESPARFGVAYRDELGTVYFELRNR